MVKVKYDVSGSDPEAAGTTLAEPPKPGVHKAKLIQCAPGFKLDDDSKPMKDRPRLEVVYEITDKDAKSPDGKSAKGAWVWAYYTFDDAEVSQRKLDQFLQTFGIATKTGKRKGTFDTDVIIGLPCKVRIRGGTWNDAYQAKVVAVVPGDEDDLDDDEAPEGEEEEEEETEEEEFEEEEEGEDLNALGSAADESDGDAIDRLTELAAEADLDPDDYDSWADLATALAGSDDEEEEDPYTGDEWDRAALAAECKNRHIKVMRSDDADALRNKLLADDGVDPF